MSRTIVLTEAELRGVLRLDLDVVACIEDAFRSLATKPVVMPPILRLDIPDHRGEVDVKTAYVPGVDGFAIKISPGFFDNPKLGLPSVNGLMALLSSETGLLDALHLDNGYLTDLRTAAAGAVAAKHLARSDAKIAAIFGAGAQARYQLEALTLVRPIREARIWARDAAKAAAVATEMRNRLGIRVRSEADPASAVQGADIIVTTTAAAQPILKCEWLSEGQHVTAMGSDSEHKNELEPTILRRADLYVADSLAQTRRLGELRHAMTAGLIGVDEEFPELGAIVAGLRSGRSDKRSLTVADLTGTGVQDTAIAVLARNRARNAQVGRIVESKSTTPERTGESS
jgi:ornithine cyclodeaminase